MAPPTAGVVVCNHPLIIHKIGFLRDSASSITRYREVTREIGAYLAYEATRDFHLEMRKIKLAKVGPEDENPNTSSTPDFDVACLKGPKPVLMPVMRSGLTLAEGILHAIPFVRMGHFGFEPKPDRTGFYEYFYAIPPISRSDNPDERRCFFIADVAIATGGVMSRCIEILIENGIRETDIRVLALLGCPQGLSRVMDRFPTISIFVAAVDPEVRDGYAYPGIGDNNYRLFGA